MYSGIYLHGYAFIQIEVITGFQIQFKEIRCIHCNVLINKTSFMLYHHTTGISTGQYKQARAWSDDETVPMEKKMFRTPDTYGYFTLSYNPFVPMTIVFSLLHGNAGLQLK